MNVIGYVRKSHGFADSLLHPNSPAMGSCRNQALSEKYVVVLRAGIKETTLHVQPPGIILFTPF